MHLLVLCGKSMRHRNPRAYGIGADSTAARKTPVSDQAEHHAHAMLRRPPIPCLGPLIRDRCIGPALDPCVQRQLPCNCERYVGGEQYDGYRGQRTRGASTHRKDRARHQQAQGCQRHDRHHPSKALVAHLVHGDVLLSAQIADAMIVDQHRDVDAGEKAQKAEGRGEQQGHGEFRLQLASERDARGAVDAHHALLIEPLPVGGPDGLDLGVGATGRLVPDDQYVGVLLGEAAVAAAPLTWALEHSEAGRKPRCHLGVQEFGPLRVGDGRAS